MTLLFDIADKSFSGPVKKDTTDYQDYFDAALGDADEFDDDFGEDVSI